MLGTAVSRVYYTISINNKPALSCLQASPSEATIENAFTQMNSDLRVYPNCNSLAKSLFASLFIKTYPLDPTQRAVLENRIYSALRTASFVQAYNQVSIVVAYSELYKAQTFGYNVSRVYYLVKFYFLFQFNLCLE